MNAEDLDIVPGRCLDELHELCMEMVETARRHRGYDPERSDEPEMQELGRNLLKRTLDLFEVSARAQELLGVMRADLRGFGMRPENCWKVTLADGSVEAGWHLAWPRWVERVAIGEDLRRRSVAEDWSKDTPADVFGIRLEADSGEEKSGEEKSGEEKSGGTVGGCYALFSDFRVRILNHDGE